MHAKVECTRNQDSRGDGMMTMAGEGWEEGGQESREVFIKRECEMSVEG